jgi:hypothetical protein
MSFEPIKMAWFIDNEELIMQFLGEYIPVYQEEILI